MLTEIDLIRVFRLRHHSISERRGDGSAQESGGGVALYADGSDPADLLRGFSGESGEYSAQCESEGVGAV